MSNEADEELTEWAEPTEKEGRKRTDWQRVADQLREHPGRWARMKGTFSHSVPGFIRSGRIQAFQPPGTFEATLKRGSADGGRTRGRLYLRYIGDDIVDFEWDVPG